MKTATKSTATERARPQPLKVSVENIPEELKKICRWVTWRYEWIGIDRWTKPPYQTNGACASSTDPTTWSDFEHVLETYRNGQRDGIGFVVSPADDIIGIDLDHCFDPKTHEGEPWTLDVIQKMQSYSEFSPSNTGVRIFVKGNLPNGDDGRKVGNLEIYSAGRYLTVTGHRLKNAPVTIEPRQEAIEWFLETYFKDKPKVKPKPKPNGSWNPSDEELLTKAYAARNGEKLRALFTGDMSAYPSLSEADLALCSMLAFWASDEAQVDRLFRRSALYRPKWDEKHGATTYGERTIEKAWVNRSESYQANEHITNGEAKEQQQKSKKPLIEIMEKVEEEETDFLWANRIPRAKVTDFSGDPGVGKSTVASAIAADLSTGRALPFDKEPEAPLRSLIIAAEDGAADTLKPRLRRMGADMSMIAIPHRSLMPSQINPMLIDQMLDEFPAALVVIDPIIAYTNHRNTDKASDVRDILGPLTVIAEKHRTAIILIRHLNKSTQSKALYRGQGSIDFAAACRGAFVFAQDPNDPERRLMAHVKSSLSKLQPTLEFSIGDNGEFSWGEQTTETADEALGTGEPRKERERVQTDKAREFLETRLASGEVASTLLEVEAEQLGLKRAIWRAKAEMGIKARKGVGGRFFWRLHDGSHGHHG